MDDLAMILVAASNKDVAGLNIAHQVLDHYPFKRTNDPSQETPVYSARGNNEEIILTIIDEETINAQDLTINFANPRLVVFLSRHSSKSGRPTLSVHTPGNFDTAELGGLPRRISIASATAMRNSLKALSLFKESMKLDYEVSYECTHHGPSLDVPTMFVELGSSMLQWRDSRAAEAIAHAAMSAISKFGDLSNTAEVGIGGPHYNQRFTAMALNGEALFSHMIPKYAIQKIDSNMLSQCVERTSEKVDFAYLDWKGIRGTDKPHVLRILKEIGLSYKKI
jgi:D-aminoacyl-tRNA deacylase